MGDPNAYPFCKTATVVVSAYNSRYKNQANYRCNGKDDQLKINEAINFVTDKGGGEVKLLEGNYNVSTSINLNNNINLVGTGKGTVIKIADSSQANAILASGISHAKISDVSIDGNRANTDNTGELYTTVNGIRIYNSSYVIVEDCYLTDAYYGGIAVDTSNNIQLLNNEIYDNRDNGIFLRPSNSRVLIQGNIVSGNDYSGIQALRSDYVDIIGNISYDNGSTGAEGDGIGFEGCRYSKIADNIIYGNGIQGIKVDYTVEGAGGDQRSSHISISNNTIYNHADENNCGIEILRSDDVDISGNYILGNHYGINIGDVAEVSINNNIIREQIGTGIRAHHAAATGPVNIRNNYIEGGSNHGIEMHITKAIITGNTIKDNDGQGIRLNVGADHQITNNFIYDNTGNGVFVTSGCGTADIFSNRFWNTGSAQDRALYEESGGGPTQLVGNRISDQNSASFEFSHADSIAQDNIGVNITDDSKYRRCKNTSGGGLVKGDIVIIKAVAAGYEVATTTTQGDDAVLGMTAETIANNVYGMIQTLGKTTALKVDGTTDIAIGDFIGTFTTAKIGMKCSAGDMAFAIALETYTTNDSAGVIDALLVPVRKI